MNKKLEQSAQHKIYKQTKTTAKPNHIKKLEDSLLALKIFAPETSVEIPLETPTDPTRLSELEFIFNQEHEAIKNINFEAEITELLKRYEAATTKQQIKELREKLKETAPGSEESAEILKQITTLQKKSK